MNSVADEIISYLGISTSLDDEEIMHYGTPRRSGRYPYGSGQQPYQHGNDFLARVEELRKQKPTYTDPKTGKTYKGDTAVAKMMGLSSSDFRNQVKWADYEKRLLQVETAKRLRDKEGMGPTAIGREMGLNESTVRSLLNPKSEHNMQQAMNTVDILRKHVDEKGMIDVGADVERDLGISKTMLDAALNYLEKAEGYPVYGGGIPQPTNSGQQTNQRVLCVPGTQKKEIYDYARVHTINEYVSHDGGETFKRKFTYPESLDSSRLKIRYNEEGGVDKDGIIELRRGVEDLSLGNSRYSQVRILVDGTHYLKGMAVYSDNMPDGVDVIFNTNKKKGTPMMDTLKEIKKDPDNPFGSLIKDADQGGQYWYKDSKTGEEKLGLINKRSDQGDWSEWADALPSQFLGKQSRAMAKKQLDLAKKDKLAEYDEYCRLENPTIKKHLLEKFADSCDSAAVHLKAAALPGQKYHVIVPINTLKDNEIYAPGYEPGTKLALIRYPHGGLFEIPILTVTHKDKLGNQIIGKDSIDAVGINKKIADQLSGADFDGDTVMCIPTHDAGGKVKIANKQPLEQLKDFDTKMAYGADEVRVGADGKKTYLRNGYEYPIMKDTQKQMGVVSNLITDMTLAGATDSELARAVKHSMVVIDAEKHKLDYKASEIENNIDGLKRKYQKREDGKYGGAATLLSRAKGEETIDKRQGSYTTNIKGSKNYDPTKPEGAKLWKKADDLYYADRVKYDKESGMMTYRTADGKKISFNAKDPEEYSKYKPVKKKDENGETIFTNEAGDIVYKRKTRTQPSTRMAETDDAYSLISTARYPMEIVYADYANSMKSLANQARLEIKATNKIAYSAENHKKYKAEVDSLMSKLNNAQLNSIRERQALRLANAEIKEKQLANPDMKKSDLKKTKQQAVTKYRQEVGSVSRRDRNIDITDREWEAIQAGAISETQLKKILNNTDIDKLKERATPRTYNTLSTAQVNRIKALSASNYSLAEIAKKMGVSTTTVSGYLKGGN